MYLSLILVSDDIELSSVDDAAEGRKHEGLGQFRVSEANVYVTGCMMNVNDWVLFVFESCSKM